MFANSYSPLGLGFFESRHRHQQPQPQKHPQQHPNLSPAGTSYEERKRREDAHRRRRIEAERSLRRQRRRDGGGLFGAYHSSPSLLVSADCHIEQQHNCLQSQSQPKLRFEEKEEEAEDGDTAARQRRQKEMMLQLRPKLDVDKDMSHRCVELPVQGHHYNEGSLSLFEEKEGHVNEDDDLTSSFSDFPPSIIYASISMSQDEMMVDNTTNTTSPAPTTTLTNHYATSLRKTGSMDSFFFTHSNQDEELADNYNITEGTDNRKQVDNGTVDHSNLDMDCDNDEDDVVSCPPHIIAEDEDEDEDTSRNDDDGRVDATFWRSSSTGWNSQGTLFDRQGKK